MGLATNGNGQAVRNRSTQADSAEHLIRPRINALLKKAIEKPLVIVCAGAGYGKTRAVYDFVRENKIATIWVQLSDQDNVPSRFWESFVHGIAQLPGVTCVEDYRNLGFPDTDDKVNQYISFRNRGMASLPHGKYLAVFDDFHLINNPEVIRFVERFAQDTQRKYSILLVSRETPKINVAALRIEDSVFDIQEEDLKFTEKELSLYLAKQDLSVGPAVLRDIYEDIDGWAFSVNLVARCLKKSPGYSGFARVAMKTHIFELMEAEVFNVVSEKLKRFLARLSLIEHLSSDLIDILSEGDEELLDEFENQNAYIRFDIYMHAYLIHHLFLDFLRTKQSILTQDEKNKTYQAAAKWCEDNDYTIDAIGYYEKTGDYEAIVSILADIPFFMHYDLALYMLDVFKRVPEEKFFQVDYLAVMYLRTVLCLNREQDFISLVEFFEKKFLKLPEKNVLRKHSLGLFYHLQGLMRFFMSTTDECYDFNIYFAKMNDHLADSPIKPGKWLANNLGAWANGFSSDKPEKAKEYMETVAQMGAYVNHCLSGVMIGLEGLAVGEMKYFHGETQGIEPLFVSAIENGWNVRQFETVHRALFYLMRVALSHGKREKAEQALRDMEALLEEKEYTQRFLSYDIAQGWYYYVLQQPDLIPSWLKEKFSPYGHAFFFENFGNQIKARYHFMTKNFAPLLAYIDEMKQRESILYGRVEMLAIEACVLYQLREKSGACAALRSAYEAVVPNGILMPFIELGKDMRTLTTAVMHESDCGIPLQWLETVNKRAALYAKYQAMMISDYEKDMGVSNEWMTLSARETDILRELYAGISRADIAVKQRLSLSTINMNIQNIYKKLGARNLTDAIRIAVERELL